MPDPETVLERVTTVADRSAQFRLDAIGDDWSRRAFDGPFFQAPAQVHRPSLGVVFVTSSSGDTATDDPAALGAGRVDEQLIYGGLTRVAADAVVVGAGTLHRDSFFPVALPALIALRASLGLPRHPVQVVLSAAGSLDLDGVRLFNLPDVRCIVVTSPRGARRLEDGVARRPWMDVVAGTSLPAQFEALKARGINRAISVGGRTSATALVDAGLVDDVYLTHAPGTGAAPGTPWYAGRQPPALQSVLLKEWTSDRGRVTFTHSCVLSAPIRHPRPA